MKVMKDDSRKDMKAYDAALSHDLLESIFACMKEHGIEKTIMGLELLLKPLQEITDGKGEKK